MQPLRIRCRPAALIWYDRWIMVDGILSHCYMLDRFGQDYYLLPTLTPVSKDVELVDMDLPLEKRAAGTEHWYWAASWCDIDACTLDRRRSAWVRSYYAKDAGDYFGQAGKVRKMDHVANLQAGPDKLYNVPLYVRTVDELVWYVVGDAEEIRRLLAPMSHIGKKCAAGWGMLLPYSDGALWQVEAWPEDWSERDGEGNLTRGVPSAKSFGEIDWFEGSVPFDLDTLQTYGFRPPYFVQANQGMLEMPV